jgi:ABC-type transport system substrate-binding protein
VLNASRPLFAGNVPLRQAVNFAVDRRALLAERGPLAGYRTDQFLFPGLLGYKDEHIYPLKAPSLPKARSLAKGHTRSGRAVLYVPDNPVGQAQAQIMQYDLAKIGLKVDVQAFPAGVLFAKLATPGEPFDIGLIGWGTNSSDPRFIATLFDGRTVGQPDSQDYSYFDSPKFDRLFDQASRLTGQARYRAYGNLDVQLSRDEAPAIPYAYDRTMNLVSARTGCAIFNPYLDLAAVCLK